MLEKPFLEPINGENMRRPRGGEEPRRMRGLLMLPC